MWPVFSFKTTLFFVRLDIIHDREFMNEGKVYAWWKVSLKYTKPNILVVTQQVPASSFP
jgi:hypothetical protein